MIDDSDGAPCHSAMARFTHIRTQNVITKLSLGVYSIVTLHAPSPNTRMVKSRAAPGKCGMAGVTFGGGDDMS